MSGSNSGCRWQARRRSGRQGPPLPAPAPATAVTGMWQLVRQQSGRVGWMSRVRIKDEGKCALSLKYRFFTAAGKMGARDAVAGAVGCPACRLGQSRACCQLLWCSLSGNNACRGRKRLAGPWYCRDEVPMPAANSGTHNGTAAVLHQRSYFIKAMQAREAMARAGRAFQRPQRGIGRCQWAPHLEKPTIATTGDPALLQVPR